MENTFKNEIKSWDGEAMFLSPNKASAQPVSHLGRAIRFLLLFLELIFGSLPSSEQTGIFLLFPSKKLIKTNLRRIYLKWTVWKNTQILKTCSCLTPPDLHSMLFSTHVLTSLQCSPLLEKYLSEMIQAYLLFIYYLMFTPGLYCLTEAGLTFAM